MDIWRSDVLVVPPAFSKHVILVEVFGQGHIHPAHILLPVIGSTIMERVGDRIVPLFWREWVLPGLVQKLHNRQGHTGMVHRLQTEIIHEQTVFVSRRALCENAANVVVQVGGTRPETVLQVRRDPGPEVISDLVGRCSAGGSYQY